MKKYILSIAVAAMAMTASAQKTVKSYDGAKFTDNWYIGINGGIGGATKAFNANGNIGLRLGKNLTPAVGLGIEGNYYFSNKADGVKNSGSGYSQLGFFGDLNLMNTFAGYKGEPRAFEVYFLTGMYWGHNYGDMNAEKYSPSYNTLVHKIAFDLAYNFGKQKEWQVYFEPSLNYAIAGVDGIKGYRVKYDINASYLNFNIGFIYKFKNSNGTHNFKLVEPADPNEIAGLNKTINDLRAANQSELNDNANLKKQVTDLTAALAVCQAKPAATVVNTIEEPGLPSVYFPLGKSIIPASQQPNVQIAADLLKNHKTWKLNIKGYASPEGNAEANQILSTKRAEAVKAELVKKYHIDANRIKAEGCGATDKLFETKEFNRVAMLATEK